MAFEINNNRIVEYQQAVNEARHRREAAEAAATEERRKQKAEQAADALIACHAAQRGHGPGRSKRAPAAGKRGGEPRDNEAHEERKADDRAWILRLNEKYRGKGRLKLSKLAQLTNADAPNAGRKTGLSRDTVRRRVLEADRRGRGPDNPALRRRQPTLSAQRAHRAHLRSLRVFAP